MNAPSELNIEDMLRVRLRVMLQEHRDLDEAIHALSANARPDPNDIANNHLAYAVQWFFFAFVALVIYAIALRKRWRAR